MKLLVFTHFSIVVLFPDLSLLMFDEFYRLLKFNDLK